MASSRAHLINQLSRSRTSSPRAEEYTTAVSATQTSFDVDRDAIHSTMQIPDHTTEQQLPNHGPQTFDYNRFPGAESERESEGSTDMSIELGRGMKRGSRFQADDMSSNAVFNLGSDSMYEVTATPPARVQNSAKKPESGLRRQASIRGAQEAAKSTETGRRTSNKRSLADAIRKINAEEDTTFVEGTAQNIATFTTRNTRFARSRQTSAQEPTVSRFASTHDTARRTVPGNPTFSSNQSFVLPDMPNLTELVSGVRKDGTPVFNRTAKSRSRFTSGSYKPEKREYHSVEGYPIPEEEQYIYASLQSLQERIQQLEAEKSEAFKRADEYEGEIIDLRSQIAAQNRPDSGFGSDEESSTIEKLKADKKKLQASVKALEDRLSRAERRISVGDISVKRVTKERDQVVTQIAIAYAQNEQLKIENESIADEHEAQATEMKSLRNEIASLRKENGDLQESLTALQSRGDKKKRRSSRLREASPDFGEASQRSLPKRQSEQKQHNMASENAEDRTHSVGDTEGLARDDLAIRIAREIEKHRMQNRQNDHNSTSQSAGGPRSEQSTQARRSLSNSSARQQRHAFKQGSIVEQRTASVPVESDFSDAESTTQLDLAKTRGKDTKTPAVPKSRQPLPREEDSRDLTLLSWLDPQEVNKLRKKLEEERRSGRLNSRSVSAPDQQSSLAQPGPRKSSLKDVTNTLNELTGRFSVTTADNADRVSKNVRVQSPHTSDEISYSAQQTDVDDVSVISNTSRRRSRQGADNQTSAFILPDITIAAGIPIPDAPAQIPHAEADCTVCPHPSTHTSAPAPTPIPVTARESYDPDSTVQTLRPSQEPPLALATVLQRLTDEFTHAKLALSACQRAYNAHDPALGKRKRLALKEKMDNLTREVENRAEVIYGLYDVLEGLQGDGEDGKKNEGQRVVEETLENLGLMGKGEVEIGRGGAGAAGFEGLGEGDEDELPWEGLSDSEAGDE